MNTASSKIPCEILGRMQADQYSDAALGLPALLLIHGWASSSHIWVDVLPQLSKKFDVYTLDIPGTNANELVECKDVDDFLNIYHRDVHPMLPKNYAVLGWSLGGGLASLIAEHCSENIFAVVTVATNPQFVQSDNWPHAMAGKIFHRFKRDLKANQNKTIERFAALQTQQAVKEKDELRWLRKNQTMAKHDSAALQRGLQWLEKIKLQDCWLNLSMPVLHQYGRLDQLVPVELVATLDEQGRNPVQVEIFEQSAHLPFMSECETWLHSVERFLVQHSLGRLSKEGLSKQKVKSLDKQAVAQAFSKAAIHYDERAVFQHEVGHKLLSMMQENVPTARSNVLDLGSGTGYFAKSLHDICAAEKLFEMDIAMGMLTHSRSKGNAVVPIRADIEALPFSNAAFDLVFANLAIQWCQCYSDVIAAIYKNLSSRGVLAFTTILEGSLCELNVAWKGVDNEPHINTLVSEDLVQAAVQESCFQVTSWKVVCHKQFFASKKLLLDSLKGIGAGNHLLDRKQGLTTKTQYHQFMAGLDAQQDQQDQQGRYYLTYNILYTILTKA